jgi:SAM-dependent methyltransferase
VAELARQPLRRVGHVVAVDIAEAALTRARERCRGLENVTFRRLDVFADPIPGHFEGVVCSELLYFAESEDAVAEVGRRLAAVLDRGGWLLSAHAHVVSDAPELPGFDWGVPFGALRIHRLLGETTGLVLEREAVCDLYRIARFRREPTRKGVAGQPTLERIERAELHPELRRYARFPAEGDAGRSTG